MAITAVERTNIVKVTIALYNAAPGASGLSDFTNFYEANGRSLSALATNLSNNNIFKALYPSFQTAAEFTTSILTPYGLQANTDAIAFVTSRFNASGGTNKGQIAFEVAIAVNNTTSATGDFATARAIFNNKALVAENYSVNLSGQAVTIGQLQAVLNNVTADAASVTAVNLINSGVTGGSNGTNEAATVFVLTANQDIVTGGIGNDFFRGVAGVVSGGQDQTTLNSSDILDGGLGQDTLVVNMTGANYGGGARIRNIETLQIGTNLPAANFDYNVNQGANEITEVTTIVADQINGGETLTINNIVRSNVTTVTPGTPGVAASAAGVVPVVVAVAATPATSVTAAAVPVINWVNDNNTQAAGIVNANYRAAELVGTTDTQVLGLSRVKDGVFNVTTGIETINVKGYSTQEVTLNNSANLDGGVNAPAADLISNTFLTKVVIDHFAGSTAVIGKAAGILSSGLTDRGVITTDGTGAATQSNLLSVGSRVTEVDASAAVANTNVRFVAKNNGAETNVIYKGGLANDYVEFEVGNVSATGGTGDDTFAFITTGILNSGFTTADSIVGGAGVDTIQLGLNGTLNTSYTVDFTEFNNKSGIDVLDLRGAVNTVTLADGFVTGSDAGLTVRTDKIVQTSLTVADNAAGSSNNENDSVNTINLTKLAGNRAITLEGGSGSDRVIGNEQSITSSATLKGGTNVGPAAGQAVTGDYDTLTVIDNAVLSRGDLSKISGFEGLVLVKSDLTSGRQFTIELTEAFILANTLAADDATATNINDRTFQIGTANAANGNALRAGDTVNIDISDLFTTANGVNTYKTALGTRGIDAATLTAAIGTAGVIYILNGATLAATAPEVIRATVADATGQASVVGSAAVPALLTGVSFASGIGATSTLGTNNNDTFVLTQADTVTGGTGNDVVTFNAGSAAAQVTLGAGADTVNVNVALTAATGILSLAAGGTVNVGANIGNMNATAATYQFVGATTLNFTTAQTGVIIEDGANVTSTASAGGAFTLGTGGQTFTSSGTAVTTVTGAAGNDTITVTSTGAHVIIGDAGDDTVTISSVAASTITGGAGIDTITITANTAVDRIVVNTNAIGTAAAARDVVTGFSATNDVIALAITATTVGTTVGNPPVVQAVAGTGALVLANTSDIVVLGFDMGGTTSVLAGTLDGAALIANLGGALTSTAAAAGDVGYILAYDNGTAFLYSFTNDATAAIVAADVALIGTFNGVAVSALGVANFVLV